LAHYQDGVNALPQYAQRRLNWELLLEFPPYESAMQLAAEEWQDPLPNGATLAKCFAGKPPPTAYPYHFNDTVHTIVGDINRCLTDNGAETLDPLGPKMARLEAAFKAPWSGQIMDIDFRSEEMRRQYQVGRQFFWAKRGQMNLSCANCHVHNAGNQLRGEVLGAALGQGVGFPVYSGGWAKNGEGMGTLHRRYTFCNKLVGAAPLPGQSDAYIALEIYQAILNTGVPLKVPALRQ
jgi:sulfur-oxidizing protein SoxA